MATIFTTPSISLKMEPKSVAEAMSEAMGEALSHLNDIARHFRKHGQHKSANELGKLSVMIINAFSEGIEHIPPSECVSDAMSAEDEYTSIHDTIQKQAVAALMSEVEKGNKEIANGHSNRVEKIQQSEEQVPQAGSWAQVASSFSNLQIQPKETMQYMSPISMSSLCESKQSQNGEGENDSIARELSGATFSCTLSQEVPDAKAGIIRVHGRASKDTIQFITTRIHEGPLQDICLESNERTRVTFQHASQALLFLKSNQEMEQMLGYGRFGRGYHVELAEITDWGEEHRRMNQPIRERRRLSFARKRLFAENISPERWKQDIRALAGFGNIDFLWVFNSGNATAVFTSTVVARKVLEVFNKWKNGRSPYNGVSVTYSSDPCEKELVLIKETNRPNITKSFVRRSLR